MILLYDFYHVSLDDRRHMLVENTSKIFWEYTWDFLYRQVEDTCVRHLPVYSIYMTTNISHAHCDTPGVVCFVWPRPAGGDRRALVSASDGRVSLTWRRHWDTGASVAGLGLRDRDWCLLPFRSLTPRGSLSVKSANYSCDSLLSWVCVSLFILIHWRVQVFGLKETGKY